MKTIRMPDDDNYPCEICGKDLQENEVVWVEEKAGDLSLNLCEACANDTVTNDPRLQIDRR